MLTGASLAAARKTAPELAEMAVEVAAAKRGPAQMALARRFLERVASEAPRLLAFIAAQMLTSDLSLTAKARLAAAALTASPADHTVALAILEGVEHLHPKARATRSEAAALTALIEAANATGRGDLTRTLAITLRGCFEPPAGGAAATAMRDARLANMQTRIGLWRAGRLLAMTGAAGASEHARRLYGNRYPYHRDHAAAAEISGRALVLNARPYLRADTLPGAHNHSNLTHSYAALNRRPGLAIDVLFLADLDFDAIRDRIAPPDVIVNNIGGPEALTAGGGAPLIRRIADHFGAPLINDPDRVEATARDATWRRIGDRGAIFFPETHRIEASLPLSAAADRVGALFGGRETILRSVAGHMGADMHRAAGRKAVLAALKALGFTEDGRDDGEAAYAIAYHEFASPDGLWRKYRIYRIDGELVGLHVMAADGWNVHRKAMRALDARDPSLGLEAASVAFAETMRDDVPAPILRALEGAMAETGLDAVGVDFALLGDGRALVFEMNAAMRIDAGERAALERLADMLDRHAALGRERRGKG